MGSELDRTPSGISDESMFRLACESAQIGIWKWDAVGDRVTCSGLIASNFTAGNGPSPCTLATFLEAIDPLHRDVVKNAIIFASDSFQIAYRLNRQGAETCWMSHQGQVSRDASGRMQMAIGIIQDISDRKRIEAELQLSARMAELRVRVGAALTRSGSLDEILHECCKIIYRELGVHAFGIWLLVEDGREFELCFQVGKFDRAIGLKVDRSLTRLGQVAQSAFPFQISDIGSDPSFLALTSETLSSSVSFSGYPLVVERRLLGVADLYSTTPLPELVLRTIASLADDLAACIERKRSEQELRRSEARKAAILESALDCILSIDHKGNLLEFNPAAERTFGYKRADVIGKPMRELIVPPRYRDAHAAGLARYLKSGDARVVGQRIEIEAVRADGVEIPVELAITLVNQSGPPIFTAYLRDISAQKNDKERIKVSNGLLQAIGGAQLRYISNYKATDVFDGLLASVLELTRSEYGLVAEVLYDPKGAPYIKAHAFTNVRWEESTRKLYDQYVATGLEFHNLSTLFGTVLTTGQTVIANDAANDPRSGGTPQGHPPMNSFLGMPVFRSEEMVGMIGLANREGGFDDTLVEYLQPFLSTCAGIIEGYRNIRRRREAEASLQLTQFSVDCAGDAVFWLAPDGKFLYVNDNACNSLGYSRDMLLTMSIFDILAEGNPDDWQADWPVHWLLLKQEGSITSESAYRRADGSTFPVESTENYIEFQGKACNCAYVRDVTKRYEEARELQVAKEEAESANRAKSEFLANMSHEVRTPMTAVLGYADLMLDPSLSQSDRDHALQGIRRNGRHLLALIDDVLDLSKIEAGKMTLDLIVYSPWRIVLEVVSLLLGYAMERGVSLKKAADGPILKLMILDPTRLRQILVNFLSNAIKFTPSGHEVTIRLFCDRVDEGNEGRLIFEVADQGIGMTPSQIADLFRPFQQGDTSTTRKYGGTGLGLTISKHLAEALGGEIIVESSPDVGSTFSLRLPLPSNDASVTWNLVDNETDQFLMAGMPKLPVPMRLSGRILVAEDSRDIQRVLLHHLTTAGLDVTVADNGEIAVKQAMESRFDLILMDMQMPKLDGYGATSSLRLSGCEVPIVALTAHAMREDRDRCIRAGCTDYLAKPVDPETLLATIARYLGIQHLLPEVDVSPKVALVDSPKPLTQDEIDFKNLRIDYARSLEKRSSDLRTALASGDLAALSTLAHQTRGVGGMYGFPEIGEVAGFVEDAVREGQDIELLADLLDEFETTMLRIMSDSGV